MKKTLFFFSLITSLLFISISCHQSDPDPCDSRYCLNGGSCIEGECDCPTGYYGVNCQNEMACDPDTPCENGGACYNGSCNCPPEYEGPLCSTEKTPQYVGVSRIEIVKFPPFKPNGDSWDMNGNGPDIFPALFKGEKIEWASKEEYEDADHQSNYYRFDNIKHVFSSPGEKHQLYIYDREASGSERMGGVEFIPFVKGEGFPKNKRLSSGKYEFVIYFTYIL
ncbi:calcium-binding EGF-like domain-containing protein [Salibacter halophilus]|uniref:Calcium-binding EGF-like domain-containing protein n=1 Tax=Salibacter halophilus TaxID=1803916 RepID=A0A6N6MAA4_9FLAO|nr:calcium-binding EGF-like domain-containing protein [Salibacter halophilus]KAB1065196.1 calcium-binding EGF-like domain-containing protein [Salibacter halophilus]